MQHQSIFAGVLACALLASPALAAGFKGEARLASPLATPAVVNVEGVEWRCEGEVCAAVSDKAAGLDSHIKECRKVAAAVGPLAGYRSRGREMTSGNLNVCNRLGAEARTAAPLAAR